MKENPIQNYKQEIEQILQFLHQGFFLTLSEKDKQDLIEACKNLLLRLDDIDNELLIIGLLGGTGVGKSTLMNALAKEKIASTSHRRPHTEKVLIYRHVSAQLPSVLIQKTTVPWHEITHQAKSIQKILLCDLPDFDSLIGEHREHVLEFLKHLDLLVWVTSPEKYADKRFYEFLKDAPKSGQNFYFVLNKADRLFNADSTEDGYQQLAKVKAQFKTYIKENMGGEKSKDIATMEPQIYCLCSLSPEDLKSLSPWNQLPHFREHIFQQRNIKEITKIKTANLDLELRKLSLKFQQELDNLKACISTLEDIISELQQKQPQWEKSGQEILQIWMGNEIQPKIIYEYADLSPLIGPSHGIGYLLQEIKKYRSTSSKPYPTTSFYLPEKLSSSLLEYMQNIENLIYTRILRQNLPESCKDMIQRDLRVTEQWKQLCSNLTELVQTAVSSFTISPMYLFRLLQGGTFLILFALLLLAMGGEAAWSNLLANFNTANYIKLFFSIVHNIFSPIGLAALVSYLLIISFLGFRFYNFYEKLLQKRSQKFIQILTNELLTIWNKQFDWFVEQLTQNKNLLAEKAQSIFKIKGKNS